MSVLLPFVVIPTTTLAISLVIAWLFIRKNRTPIGYLVGLAPILGVWTAGEVWVISACAVCAKQPGCWCEWEWVGVLGYAFVAILAILVYSALALGTAYLRNKPVAHPPELAADHRVRGRFLPVPYTSVIVVFTAAIGGFASWKLVDLANRGLFVRWQPVDVASVPRAQYVLSHGDEIHIEGGKMCAYDFIVAHPPSGVVKHGQVYQCAEYMRYQTEYVILQNGSYWTWHHEAYGENMLISNIVAITIGALLGFLGGARLSVAILARRRLAG